MCLLRHGFKTGFSKEKHQWNILQFSEYFMETWVFFTVMFSLLVLSSFPWLFRKD